MKKRKYIPTLGRHIETNFTWPKKNRTESLILTETQSKEKEMNSKYFHCRFNIQHPKQT